jgi:hypothetical protein
MRKKIDFGIRTFVKDLNKHGYKTLYSCAGHKDARNSKGEIIKNDRGYVAIKGHHNDWNLLKIAKKYVEKPIIKRKRMTSLDGVTKTYCATNISFKAKNLQKWGGG